MESLPNIAIIDLGSQYTLVIERTIRELGYRSVILDPKRAAKWLAQHSAQAIILSGGAASVYEEGAPQPPKEVLSLDHEGRHVPVLGICYGMQWMAYHLGGSVESVSHNREYGEAAIQVFEPGVFFNDVDATTSVWASHGDTVVSIPADFVATAFSSKGEVAAMQDRVRPFYGVQFHPEVAHTPQGKTMLLNFLERIAGCTKDWEAGSMVEQIRETIKANIGPEELAIMGFSGGVDSTMLATIASPVMGARLLGITIDGGHLRENELEEIHRHAKAAGIKLIVVDAREEFERVMADITDAEEKRKRFKQVYVATFTKAAQGFGATVIFQGTLAPDRIESGDTGGSLIKSHHNVGLVFGNLKQAHPIDHLFKYEVRALAKELGLPESVWSRMPFPGPGLFLRVNGIPATQDELDIVRWAEARVREILERHNLYHTISQLVVSLNGVKTVGVKGDARVYGYAIVVRAIETIDFMTAKGIRLPSDVKDEIEVAITSHPEIVCVYYNETDKPPATTEPE